MLSTLGSTFNESIETLAADWVSTATSAWRRADIGGITAAWRGPGLHSDLGPFFQWGFARDGADIADIDRL